MIHLKLCWSFTLREDQPFPQHPACRQNIHVRKIRNCHFYFWSHTQRIITDFIIESWLLHLAYLYLLISSICEQRYFYFAWEERFLTWVNVFHSQNNSISILCLTNQCWEAIKASHILYHSFQNLITTFVARINNSHPIIALRITHLTIFMRKKFQ